MSRSLGLRRVRRRRRLLDVRSGDSVQIHMTCTVSGVRPRSTGASCGRLCIFRLWPSAWRLGAAPTSLAIIDEVAAANRVRELCCTPRVPIYCAVSGPQQNRPRATIERLRWSRMTANADFSSGACPKSSGWHREGASEWRNSGLESTERGYRGPWLRGSARKAAGTQETRDCRSQSFFTLLVAERRKRIYWRR
jgi:hypothetical protein